MYMNLLPFGSTFKNGKAVLIGMFLLLKHLIDMLNMEFSKVVIILGSFLILKAF